MTRLATLLLALAATLSLWLAGAQHRPLLALRREYRLNWGEPLENSPPLVGFTTIALGGFRGIIADVLWLRAAKLQEEQKYFELVQLADWITKLEPRFALVWAFHGWNMAYNISVLLDDPADRWRWVKHGIELLRDDGLRYNPGDARLYWELGTLYQHKLGGYLDQAHPYYKRAWAEEMAQCFDGPCPDLAYLTTHPDDPRAVRLRQQYKLEPAEMAKVEAQYGPLDWRLPEAHAIYWATQGRRYAREFDAIQIERIIFHSMQQAFWQGRAVVNREEDLFWPAPNLELLPRVCRAYEAAIAAHPEERSIRAGYENFLKAALVLLYEHHRLGQAREVFENLRQRAPGLVGERTFEQFVRREYVDRVTRMNPQEAQGAVTGALYQSYRWLALGETDWATGLARLARLFYDRYMEARSDPQERERTGLPPFEQLRQAALEQARASLRSAAARERLEKARQSTGE